MGTMTNTVSEMVALVSAAQHTAACHQKNCILLLKVYQKSDFRTFYEALLRQVDLILQVDFKYKHPFLDKLTDFLAKFCDTLQRKPKHNNEEESFTEDPLITKLFEHLLEASQLISDIIRFRSCQLINKILDRLAGNDLSDDLCQQLQEVLLDRLSDSKSAIRVQAIIALHRLQDPTDPEDKIIDELVQLLSDSHAKVRQLSVEKIAARKDVIDHLIKRSRDIDLNVRLAAFERLSIFSKFLKIKDKRTLLLTGFLDPSEKVKKYVLTQFLGSWLEHYDNKIILLMKAVRFDADEKDIEKTMNLYDNILNKFYFKARTLRELNEVLILNDDRVLPYEELDWETISYWKMYITFLSENEDAEYHLKNVFPEMVHFCRYIKGYTDYSKDCIADEFLEKQYIIKQFFLMIRTYDLADPIRRQCLHTLVDFILKRVDLMDDVVETIVGSLELTMPDPNIRCQFGCEIISDLLFPIDAAEELKKQQEQEFALSKLKVKLNCLKEDQDNAVTTGDYIEADRLKHLIEDINLQIINLKDKMHEPAEEIKKTTDLSTIYKCLDIAWAVLRTAKVSTLIPSLKSLKSDVIPELLIHENEIVRMKALRCYAICCIYDKTTAQSGIHILAVPIAAYQAGEECDTQTLIVCMSAISDLIRIYGADLMAEPNEDQLSESVNEEHQKVFTGGTSLTALIQGLVDLMDDEQYEIQITASEGLGKLVLNERIHSSALISRLVLKWCQPVEKDQPENEKLKQFIGCILERIPHLPNSTEQLEEAVLLTINTLAKAPRNSPLAYVDIDNIARFMLALCKVSLKGQQIHSNIALSICTKIMQNPNSKINSDYTKILLMVDVPDDTVIKKELLKLCEVARENITDKTTVKNLTKLIANLTETPQNDCNIMEAMEIEDEPEIVGD